MLEPLHDRLGDAAPELSVLMPVRNTAHFVREAVASVLAQEGCAAEILISDDCSTDGSLDAVLREVEPYRGPHTVRVMRTRKRLAIDHLGALVGAATGRLLVQAHGDDVSLPGRLSTLLDIHRRTGASLITSRVRRRDGDGEREEKLPPDQPEGWIALETVVRRNPGDPGILAGARYGIERAVLESFPPLTAAYLPIGHDVLQPFRAALLGGVWFCATSLVGYRVHAGQWTHRLWDMRLPETNRFGFLLNRLGVLRAMVRDLRHAAATDLLPPPRIAAVRQLVDRTTMAALDELLFLRGRLRNMGREPLWVTEDLLDRVNRQAADGPPPKAFDP